MARVLGGFFYSVRYINQYELHLIYIVIHFLNQSIIRTVFQKHHTVYFYYLLVLGVVVLVQKEAGIGHPQILNTFTITVCMLWMRV